MSDCTGRRLATAEPGDVRELPPFEGAELEVARFFGLEPDEVAAVLAEE